MICKGWKQAGLLRDFYKEFQIQAIKDNMTTLLFPIGLDPHTSSVVEADMRSEDVTSDPNDLVEEAMHQNLDHVQHCEVVLQQQVSLSYMCWLGEQSDPDLQQSRHLVRFHTTSNSLKKNWVLSLCC